MKTKLLLLLTIVSSMVFFTCSDDDDAVGPTEFNGPIAIVPYKGVVYILNSNYNQTQNNAVLSVIDAKTHQKYASLKIPSLAWQIKLLDKQQRLMISTFSKRSIVMIDITKPKAPTVKHNYQFDFGEYNGALLPFALESNADQSSVYVTTRVQKNGQGFHITGSWLYRLDVRHPGEPILLRKLAMHTELMHFLKDRNALLLLPTSMGMQAPKYDKLDVLWANEKTAIKARYRYAIYDVDQLTNTDYEPKRGYLAPNSKNYAYGNFTAKDVSNVAAFTFSESVNNNNNNTDDGNSLTPVNANANANLNSTNLSDTDLGLIALSPDNNLALLLSGFGDGNKAVSVRELYTVNPLDKEVVLKTHPIDAIVDYRKGQASLILLHWLQSGKVLNSEISISEVPKLATATSVRIDLGPGLGSVAMRRVGNTLWVANFYDNSVFVLTDALSDGHYVVTDKIR